MLRESWAPGSLVSKLDVTLRTCCLSVAYPIYLYGQTRRRSGVAPAWDGTQLAICLASSGD